MIRRAITFVGTRYIAYLLLAYKNNIRYTIPVSDSQKEIKIDMKQASTTFKNTLDALESEDEFESPEDFFSRAQNVTNAAAEVTFYTDETPPSQRITSADEMWIDTSNEGYEGQLAVDVFQDAKKVYVQAIIGGIAPEEIEVHLNNDMLTIKGMRSQPNANIAPEQFYIQECYWGGFSRSIIMPVDVVNDGVEATVENGVLTIALPKSNRPKNSRIEIISKE